MSGNLGTIPGCTAASMCNLGRGRMVLWSRRCGGTQEGPLLFPVLPPDFLCNLGPVSLNLSRALGKWGLLVVLRGRRSFVLVRGYCGGGEC